MSQVGQELAAVPFEDLIKSMAMGIAAAQVELDLSSAKIAAMMSGTKEEDRITFQGESLSLFELGLRPTFYQFVDTIMEIKIVVKMATSTSSESSYSSTTRTAKAKLNFWKAEASASVNTTTVDAKYAKKYDYSVEGSSMVRTKLVPVPPPAILEERIRRIMDKENPTP